MTEKRKVLIISFLTTILAVTSGLALKGWHQAAKYQMFLENSYTHAYYELATAVSELDRTLQKAQYATTPVMIEALCSDIHGKAVSAQMALGELPSSAAVLEQTAAFLARTGDYTFALAKTAVSEGLDAQAHSTLRDLAQTSSSLSASLLSLQADLDGGSIPISALIRAEERLDQNTSDGQASPGGTTFQTIEAEFPKTPALIYDGPFSEHLSSRTPLALEGLPMSTPAAAQAAAAAFLNLPPEALSLTSQGEGVLPTWGFSAATELGELYIELTQRGCKALSLFTSRNAGASTISVSDALETARAFLRERGFVSMEESYYVNQSGVLTVNFAPNESGILCYPDLVKVSVALDTGTVVGFESHGWIMNHTERQLAAPSVDKDTAAAVVSPDLEILSHQLALIPTGGEYEVLCHEFKCRTEQDTHVIVYINAATGSEEQILLLLEDENGTLVW